MDPVPVLRWLAVLAVCWSLGLPVAARLFRSFPHRGSALAVPTALAVMGLPAYWVGRVDADAGLLAGWAVLALAAAGALRADEALRSGLSGLGSGRSRLRSDGSNGARRGALRAVVRQSIRRGFDGRPAVPTRRALAPVVVFGVAFGAMLAVRATAPTVTAAGGEQFLDFSLLQATLDARSLPPEDPWFAGRPVRYYYGGYLLSALLTAGADLPPRVAYNLLGPTFYAALATGAYGVAAALADRAGRSPSLGGVAGAFLAAAAGNLATPARLLLGVAPDWAVDRVGPTLVAAAPGSYEEALSTVSDPGSWWYWNARYVIPDTPNVFPAWTFYNGDLRPHMTGAPLLVLAVAVLVAYVATPADRAGRRWGLALVALPAVAGLIGLVNSWDLPVVAGLAGLTFVADPPSAPSWSTPSGSPPVAVPSPGASAGSGPGRIRGVVGRLLAGTALAAAVVALAVGWVLPYFLSRLAPSRGVGLLPPGSPVGPFLLVHGGFLALFVAYLAGIARGAAADLARAVDPRGDGALTSAIGVVAGAVAVVAVAAVGAGLWSLSGPAAALTWLLVAVAWALRGREGAGYEATLVLAGLGLVLVAELAYARVYPHDPDAPRWNTVYKLYHSTWLLWGIAGGAVLARLVGWAGDRLPAPLPSVRPSRVLPVARRIAGRLRAATDPRAVADGGRGDSTGAESTGDRNPDGGTDGPDRPDGAAGADRPDDADRSPTAIDVGRRLWSRVAVPAALLCLVCGVLVAAGTFPALTVGDRVTDAAREGGSLDALAEHERERPEAFAAIAWLDDRPGRPTLVAAPGTEPYTWQNPASSLTGLPTVVGWIHERGYRGEAAYERRRTAVRRIYEGSPANATALLRRYDVDYVYVGAVERDRYDLRGFENVSAVRPAFGRGDVTVYAVGVGDERWSTDVATGLADG